MAFEWDVHKSQICIVHLCIENICTDVHTVAWPSMHLEARMVYVAM